MLQNLLSFHIIAVVCWFAGLLYSGRLLIYALEAQTLPDNERAILQKQYALMKRRLWYGITMPAMFATVGVGLALLHQTASLHQPWFLLKVLAIVVLLLYHFLCHWLIKQQAQGIYRFSSRQLRIWNEVGTALLIFIVLLAKHKQVLPALTSSAIAVGVLLVLYVVIQQLRQRKTST